LRRGSSIALPGLIAGAWLTILVTQLTGTAAALHHHALIEGGPPIWEAIPLFLFGWLVMVVAMMLPASMPTLRIVETAARGLARPRLARSTFLLGFGLVWVVFGSIAFLGDMVLHHVVDTTPWLAARPWLIEAGILAIAGGYQFAPTKRRDLAACRHPGDPASTAPMLEQDPTRLGLRHGLACFGSSWALMLLMFGEGFGNLWWMAAMTGVMVYETSGRHGPRAASLVGIILLLAALTVLSSPLPGGGVTL
jgi:predicted metal-binding membrane protein